MDPNQLDTVLTYGIYAALAGLGLALMMYLVAAIGGRSARTAGIVGAVFSLLYVGIGVGGAAVRVEMNVTPAAPETASDKPAEATPPVEPAEDGPSPAVVSAAERLQTAVEAEQWDEARAAHAALAALDPEHASLAAAKTAIDLGLAAEAEGSTGGETDGASGDEDTGSGSDSGSSGDADGSSGDGDVDAIIEDDDGGEEPEAAEPAPATKKRRRRRRRRPPSSGPGDTPTEPDPSDTPTEPKKPEPSGDSPKPMPKEPAEPRPEPKPEPKKPEPSGDSPKPMPKEPAEPKPSVPAPGGAV